MKRSYSVSKNHTGTWGIIKNDRDWNIILPSYETRATARIVARCLGMSVGGSPEAEKLDELHEAALERSARTGETLDLATRGAAYLWAHWMAGKNLDIICEGGCCTERATTVRQCMAALDRCLWLCNSCSDLFDLGWTWRSPKRRRSQERERR